MISIEELPEGYDEDMTVQAELVPGALMMVPSQSKRIFQEGIVEKASDEEALPINMTPSPTEAPQNVLTNKEGAGEGTEIMRKPLR